MSQEMAQALARDARAVTLWDLAREMVGKVFDAGADRLVEDTVAEPDIKALCQRFRDEAAALGYSMSGSDVDLYMEVVRPLHLAQVHEGR